MHGLYSWNSAAHTLLQEFGASDPSNMRSFQARFAAPVKPGDKLATEAWTMGQQDKEGWIEVRFITKIVPKGGEDGQVVLSNGRARMKVQGKRASRL